MLTLEELLPKLCKAKVFSTLEAKNSFYQISLDDQFHPIWSSYANERLLGSIFRRSANLHYFLPFCIYLKNAELSWWQLDIRVKLWEQLQLVLKKLALMWTFGECCVNSEFQELSQRDGCPTPWMQSGRSLKQQLLPSPFVIGNTFMSRLIVKEKTYPLEYLGTAWLEIEITHKLNLYLEKHEKELSPSLLVKPRKGADLRVSTWLTPDRSRKSSIKFLHNWRRAAWTDLEHSVLECMWLWLWPDWLPRPLSGIICGIV